MKNKKRWINFVPGFFMGLSLPVLSLLSIMAATHQTFSLQTLINIHRINPFIWLLDCAPFLFSYFVAENQRQKRLLDEQVERWNRSNQEKLEFFKSLITNAGFAASMLDKDLRIVAVSRDYEEMFGYKEDEILGKYLYQLTDIDEISRTIENNVKLVQTENLLKTSGKRQRKDGSLFDVEIFGFPLFTDGGFIGSVGIYNDVSEKKRIEQNLVLSEKRYKGLFYDSPIALLEEDYSEVKLYLTALSEQGIDVIERLKNDNELVRECIRLIRLLNVNQSALEMFEVESLAELQAGLEKTVTDESLNAFRHEFIALAKGNRVFESEVAQKKRYTDDYLYGLLRLSLAPGAEENWEKVIISIVDITGHRKAEKELRYMSFHDALTGLYNRAYFEEEIRRLEKSRQFPVTIIAADLDNLKAVNDTLGHDAGDQVLQGVATILTNSFRNEDVVARVGGDEFAVILPYVDKQIGEGICNRIVAETEKYNLNGAAE